METDFPLELDAFARGYLTSAAQRLDATVPCVPCDTDDYLQDLQLNLLHRKPRFDATKAAWSTYVKLVTDHRAIELRHRCLKGRCHALNTIQRVEAEAVPWPTSKAQHEEKSNLDSLRLDIAEWVSSLDPDEQKLCRALMRGSISETARELGFPRTTIVDRISRLRKRHERTSLREFAPRPKLFRQPVVSDQ